MLARLVLLAVLLPSPVVAASWVLDPETSVAVDVPWQGSAVTVTFPPPTGSIVFDPEHPETTKATVTVSAREATTGVPLVDPVVKSPDFLGAEAHPTMTFELDSLKLVSKSAAEVTGRITFRGVTKPARFDARVTRYGAAADDPDRFDAGFDLTGSIDRTAFGSTGGLPDVPAVLPVRIRLLMHSE